MKEKSYLNNSYNSKCKIRYTLFFFFMFVLFAVITVLNINIGSVNISVPENFKIIFLKQGDK